MVSPPIFRLWAGISCLAGALERNRVFARSGMGVINPNLYVLLVAPPGVGKFVVETVRGLWRDAREPGSKLAAFRVASDSITNASMMDELGAAKIIKIQQAGPPLTYHSLLLAAEEFEVLVPAYDKQFISSLNTIYNCKDEHSEKRRTSIVKELNISAPCFNLLGGAQPVYLAHTFPEEAWGTGLIRRIIMIYSNDSPLRSFFFSPGDTSEIRAKLVKQLGFLAFLQAELGWQREAAEKIETWHLSGGPPLPKHSKLVNYNRSRSVFIAKLAMISAVAREQYEVIELVDVERAMEWLFKAEALMPDIFKDMKGKSDRSVLEELWYYLDGMKRKKNDSISSEAIYTFLSHHVPSEKTGKMFELAEKSGMIVRVGGTVDQYKVKVGDRGPVGLDF